MMTTFESALLLLENELITAKDVSLKRMRCLGFAMGHTCQFYDAEKERTSGGLPLIILSLLVEAYESWDLFYRSICIHRGQDEIITTRFNESPELKNLQRVINFLIKLSQLDPILGEEIGRAGSQTVLSKILVQIKRCISIAESSCETTEEEYDALMDLQDSACEVYSPIIRGMPFTDEELRSRLPLVYNLTPVDHSGELKDTTFLIGQVTKRQSAQADVGFVMWPSAIVLSRWVMSNPHFIRGKSILELGAGCGLVGIVAASLLTKENNDNEQTSEVSSSNVIITDINDSVMENISQNIKLNEVDSEASIAKLDFYRQSGENYFPGGWIASEMKGMIEQPRKPVDVILAADIICQREDAIAAAKTIHDALVPPGDGRCGGVAYIVCADSEHRFGVEIFPSECESIGLDVKTTKVAELYDGELLLECMESACGYVDGMELTFFEVKK